MPLLPRIVLFCCFALSAFAAPETAVDLQAFAGAWKENFAKSHQRPLYPVTYTFTRQPDGAIQLLSVSQAFPNAAPAVIHFDGKDYPKPGAANASADDTMAWTKAAANSRTFDVVYKHKGEWAGSVHWTLSTDGNILNVENRTQRDEHALATITICERAPGSSSTPRDSRSPLLGVWKSVAIRGTIPWITRYEVTPAGELRYTNVQTKLTYAAKPDGKEYASSLAGVMVKLEPAGPRSLRKIFLRGGQIISESVLSVSADGRTLTDITPAPKGETAESGVQTFDRQ